MGSDGVRDEFLAAPNGEHAPRYGGQGRRQTYLPRRLGMPLVPYPAVTPVASLHLRAPAISMHVRAAIKDVFDGKRNQVCD
jgi:hypothetical protein